MVRLTKKLTMLKLVFNKDPDIKRVCLIALLLMFELILVKLIEILSSNRQPSILEIEYLIALGCLQFVTYVLTFLRKEE